MSDDQRPEADPVEVTWTAAGTGQDIRDSVTSVTVYDPAQVEAWRELYDAAGALIANEGPFFATRLRRAWEAVDHILHSWERVEATEVAPGNYARKSDFTVEPAASGFYVVSDDDGDDH